MHCLLRSKNEVERLTSSSVDLVKYESTKNALAGLDPKEAGDVRSYHALMNAAKDQIVECERTVVKHRASILEIEKQRQLNAQQRHYDRRRSCCRICSLFDWCDFSSMNCCLRL